MEYVSSSTDFQKKVTLHLMFPFVPVPKICRTGRGLKFQKELIIFADSQVNAEGTGGEKS